MSGIALPVLSDNGLSRYLDDVRKFPMLSEEEEFMLAKAWTRHEDVKAAEKLVTSHLRLVVKIAMGYRGYGLPVTDLISEGNVGLMQAVKRFDPDRGFRLSTYAMWWIKAQIQEYVLRSWSLVKIGTTAAQKKLFFNLRKMKQNITASHDKNLLPEEIKQIANELDVTERDVVEMDQRMSGTDASLNAVISQDGESEWLDYLSDDSADQETIVAEYEDLSQKKQLLANALETLNARERDIIMQRQLQEKPVTLEELSQKYEVSRERIRQIEARALEKLQEAVQSSN